MQTLSFDQILQAARKLTPQEQEALIAHLRASRQEASSERAALLREQIESAFERREAAGAFSNLGSLKGKFKRPGPHADGDAVEAHLRNLSTDWQEDLDDLTG